MILLHFVTLAEPVTSLHWIGDAVHVSSISKSHDVRYETFA